jgi:hypothetical protein
MMIIGKKILIFVLKLFFISIIISPIIKASVTKKQ